MAMAGGAAVAASTSDRSSSGASSRSPERRVRSGTVDRGRQREVISAIAAAIDALEPEIAALGALHGMWRSSRGAAAGTAGRRREGDQLLLDFGAEPIGVAALWIGRADRVERRQRVAEVTAGHERPGIGQNHFAAARKRQRDLARDRRRRRRFRRRELSSERQDRPDTEDRSEVDATPRGRERAAGEERGQRHHTKHAHARPANGARRRSTAWRRLSADGRSALPVRATPPSRVDSGVRGPRALPRMARRRRWRPGAGDAPRPPRRAGRPRRRSAAALRTRAAARRARSARARCRRARAAWLRSRNSARVQTLMACS